MPDRIWVGSSAAWGMFAVVAVASAVALRLYPLGGLEDDLIYAALYPAVAIAAIAGGYRAGLFAAVLSTLGVTVLVAPVQDISGVLCLLMFVAGCVLIAAVTERMRRNRRRMIEAEIAARCAQEQSRNNHRLRWALQAARGGVWDWDLEGGEVWWSPEMYELWGINCETRMLFDSAMAAVYPEDRAGLKDAIVLAVKSSEGFDCEFRVLHGVKGMRWMRASGESIRDEAGKAVRLTGLAMDITQSKQVSAELQERDERLRAIVDTAPDAIVTVDESGFIKSFNPAAERIFGYRRDEVLGIHVNILLPPKADGMDCSDLRNYLNDDGSPPSGAPHDVTGLRKDGSSFFLELTVARWHDSAGRMHLSGIMRDVSDRRRAEESLRKFSRVVEQTASTIIIIDTKGVIEYVNPAFAVTSGYSVEEAVGRQANILKSGLAQDEVYQDIWKTMNEGGVWQGEFHNHRKDGTLYWESVIISPIRDEHGRITHFAGIMDDITERKKVEDSLLRAQRLDAIGQLAGAVAHDFNNLLSVIIASLELCELRSHDRKVRRMLVRALQAAEAGVNFNKRLLAVARKRDLQPVSFNLKQGVVAMSDLLKRMLGADVELTTHLDAKLWPVRVDPGEIDSAILNLALNARDAMPDGGQLLIGARNRTLDAQAASAERDAHEGDYVELFVKDTGTGMTEEVLEHALEPFFTTKEAGRGSGLGLSSVQGFAHQSGGFVTLSSQLGVGTTVSIWMPRAPDEKPEAGRDRKETGAILQRGSGQLVLVVEDDEALREVTRERLEALGYDVIDAESGPDAVRLLEEDDQIALVFSDVVMAGGMTGYDLAEWVLENRPGVKLLLTTAFASGHAKAAANNKSRLHSVPLLYKPVTLDKLARALHDALTHAPGGASADE